MIEEMRQLGTFDYLNEPDLSSLHGKPIDLGLIQLSTSASCKVRLNVA